MRQYQFRRATATGEIQTGIVEAPNSKMAERLALGQPGDILLQLKKRPFYLSFSFNKQLTSPKIEIEEVINFTRQLHSLLSAGIPMMDCLNAVMTLTKDKQFKTVIQDIIVELESGASFSKGLQRHLDVFGKDYISLVRAGEASGALDKILEELFDLLDWEKNLKKKIIGAFRYPLLVIGISILALIGMFTFVIPKFAKIFGGSSAELPAFTRVLLQVNTFMTSNGLAMLLGSAAFLTLLVLAYRQEKVKFQVDKWVLRIPIFGSIFSKYLIARFSRVFSILYANGVPIIDALGIVNSLSQNAAYQFEVQYMADQLHRGIQMGLSSDSTYLFSGLVGQMIKTGEKSGSLDIMLSKVCDLYSEDIDYMVDNIFSYMEPIIVGIMGVFILSLALGVFMPMWNMLSKLQSG